LISRGHIYHILSNPIYAGRLRHKEQIHEGQHAAIVDEDIWSRVQLLLGDQTQRRKPSSQDVHSFLVGKLFDDRGHRMGPSHAAKGGRRWRYYISRAVLRGRKQDAGSVARVSAAEIEKQVLEVIKGLLPPLERSLDGYGESLDHSISSSLSSALAASIPSSLDQSSFEDRARSAIERVTIGKTGIEIQLSDAAVVEGDRIVTIPWSLPSPYRRREILQGEGEPSSAIRPMRVRARAVFVEALGDAHRWLDELMRHPDQTTATIAIREGKTERSIRMTLSVAFVAPPIVTAAIEGRLPRGFGVKRLMDLPMVWSQQWTALGLAPSA
jgi:hypothetical protein